MGGKKGRKSTSKVKTETKPWRSYCYCKRPEEFDWTVTCASCSRWYHGQCIAFPSELRPRVDKLYCRRCQIRYKLSSVLLPKCRLESCLNPISEGSEYCSQEHCEEFWKSATVLLKNAPSTNTHILKWLAKRCGDDHTAFMQATPSNLPKPSKPPNAEQQRRLERLERANETSCSQDICGFDSKLLNLIQKPLDEELMDEELTEPCNGDRKQCTKHQNWQEMIRRRLTTANIDESDLPDSEWLRKRAKYLVAGTTRLSRRKGWKAAYFIPYVWDDDDHDFFLDNNPEPFWDKNF